MTNSENKRPNFRLMTPFFPITSKIFNLLSNTQIFLFLFQILFIFICSKNSKLSN